MYSIQHIGLKYYIDLIGALIYLKLASELYFGRVLIYA